MVEWIIYHDFLFPFGSIKIYIPHDEHIDNNGSWVLATQFALVKGMLGDVVWAEAYDVLSQLASHSCPCVIPHEENIL